MRPPGDSAFVAAVITLACAAAFVASSGIVREVGRDRSDAPATALVVGLGAAGLVGVLFSLNALRDWWADRKSSRR